MGYLQPSLHVFDPIYPTETRKQSSRMAEPRMQDFLKEFNFQNLKNAQKQLNELN